MWTFCLNFDVSLNAVEREVKQMKDPIVAMYDGFDEAYGDEPTGTPLYDETGTQINTEALYEAFDDVRDGN